MTPLICAVYARMEGMLIRKEIRKEGKKDTKEGRKGKN